MEILLRGIGKKYNGQWLFREINKTIPSLGTCAITGPNGSGKSTLLQLIYQYAIPSEGEIEFISDQKSLESEDAAKHISFVAPYLELPEELTLNEVIHFHFRMKKTTTLDYSFIIHSCGLQGNEGKQVKYFSSGMKQRLKLALGFYSEKKLLLLDEPLTNLDKQGEAWYQKEIESLLNQCTIIVASNQEKEWRFCNKEINLH